MLQTEPTVAEPFAPAASPPSRPATAPAAVAAATPRVSVLVPTYNYARYLPEAIGSVLAQDFQDYELIIVDDCSQDESETVIRDFAARDPRIRFQINRPNRGMVANWNHCLSLARGEYVQFLFGDDKLADRQALSKMVRLLEANPRAVMAVAARSIIDERSEVLEVCAQLGVSGLLPGRGVILRCLEENANLIGEPSVVLLRRAATARGFNLQYRQLTDLEMWFHLLETGDAVYTPEPLYSFRRHSLQQTAVNRVKRIGERESLLLMIEYFARPWVRNAKRRRFLFSHIYHLQKTRASDPEAKDLEQKLIQSLGTGWYRWYWFRHKLGRPFTNLKRSFCKRVLKRSAR